MYGEACDDSDEEEDVDEEGGEGGGAVLGCLEQRCLPGSLPRLHAGYSWQPSS